MLAITAARFHKQSLQYCRERKWGMVKIETS